MMLYTILVKLAASQFRAELFKSLEAAQSGEEVVITYKGREYVLSLKRKPSKFKHVKQRPGAVLDWQALASDSPWDEASWAAKWESGPASKKAGSQR